MNIIIKVVASVFVLSIAQSGIACDYPERVRIPTGSTASKDDMITGQKDVKTFVAAMEVYLDCIVEEEKLARLALEDLAPEVEQQREELLNKKYNAAVDDMEKVAAQFNEEVRYYKEQSE